MSQNGAFHVVQLQIIHLLILQCYVPLTRGPSAIAGSLALCGEKSSYTNYSNSFTGEFDKTLVSCVSNVHYHIKLNRSVYV